MQVLSDSSPRVLASRPWFLLQIEPDFHLLAQHLLPRRLSLCFPASLETYQRGHRELALLRPVDLTARPGRQLVEEILLVHRRVLRSDAVTRLYHLKT